MTIWAGESVSLFGSQITRLALPTVAILAGRRRANPLILSENISRLEMESTAAVRPRRTIARFVLGVPLGILLGAEVGLAGLPALLNPVFWLLYAFLLLTWDRLITRLQLDQWGLWLLAMAYALVISALVDWQQFAASSETIIRVADLDLVFVMLVAMSWGAFAVMWFHVLETFWPRAPAPVGQRRRLSTRLLWGSFLVFLFLVSAGAVSSETQHLFGNGNVFLMALGGVVLLMWLAHLRRQGSARPPGSGQRSNWLLRMALAIAVLQLVLGLAPGPVRGLLTVAGVGFYTLVAFIILLRKEVYI